MASPTNLACSKDIRWHLQLTSLAVKISDGISNSYSTTFLLQMDIFSRGEGKVARKVLSSFTGWIKLELDSRKLKTNCLQRGCEGDLMSLRVFLKELVSNFLFRIVEVIFISHSINDLLFRSKLFWSSFSNNTSPPIEWRGRAGEVAPRGDWQRQETFACTVHKRRRLYWRYFPRIQWQ